MKRILFITTHPDIGGAQRWTYEQMILTEQEFELYFVTGSDGWLLGKAKELCRETLVDKRIYSFISAGFLYTLYRFVISNHIDLIIASSANAGIYARGLKLFLPHLSVVYVSHGWSAIYRGNRFYRFAEKVLSYLSTKILTVSSTDYVKAIDILKIGSEKLKLIENAIFPYGDEGCEGEKYMETEKRFTVVMVARYETPKRQDILIKVAALLPEIHFILVGEGRNQHILQQAAPDNVSFRHTVDNVECILRSSDLFVLLSDSEGMPLAVIEELAAGKPILVSDIPALTSFVRGNGFAVKNSVDAVTQVLRDIQKMDISQMGKRSKQLFHERFDLNQKQETFLSFYKGLL
jgi:glycosyltransferase involved in cell wall biosynthesis